ncbi:Tetratricopeptide TPR_2 repeat-containing protein [Calothrix sp. PCC 7507]|nr:Tetratricopeptide TPR_2 repeat-containing protein [Calothrix sp. PCC 7507]
MTQDFLARLTAAKTDTERSYIVTENLLKTLPLDLFTAVWAVAIPHWFNAEILAALCPQFQDEATELYQELQKLSFVEVFPEQGHNIHALTRKLLLEELWNHKRDEFLIFSARATEYFSQQTTPESNIEWLYHLVVSDTANQGDEFCSLAQLWTNNFRRAEMEYLVKTLLEQVESNRISTAAKAKIYYWAGNTKFSVAQAPEAWDAYKQALKCYREIGVSKAAHLEARLGEANTLKAIGDVLQFLNRHHEALEYYEAALEIYNEIGDRPGETNTLKAISDILQFLSLDDVKTLKALGDILQFLKLIYQKALELYREIANRLETAHTFIKVPHELLPEYSETYIMPHHQTKASLVSTKFLPENSKTYINHPKYGMLQRICTVDENKDMFASLYAKSLFFLVTAKDTDIKYEPMGSKEAKTLLENCLLTLDQNQRSPEYDQLQSVFHRTFS